MNKKIKAKSLKKITALLLALIAVISSASSLTALAALDNDYSFEFDIPKGGRGHSTSIKHRSTTNTDNTWKAYMTRSYEPTKAHPKGDGITASNFVLGAKKGSDTHFYNGSAPHTVLEGVTSKHRYYFPAYSKASDADTLLYAEDNGGATVGYHVKGYWDEETGYIYEE